MGGAPRRTSVPQVEVRPVGKDNWRDVAALRVQEEQQDFVAATSYYLTLCLMEQLWQPVAAYAGDEVVGFAMWAVDPDEPDATWIGGVVIDHRHQSRGLGRALMMALITWLRERPGCDSVALSCEPSNERARALYLSMGFVETGEMVDAEVVMRLHCR